MNQRKTETIRALHRELLRQLRLVGAPLARGHIALLLSAEGALELHEITTRIGLDKTAASRAIRDLKVKERVRDEVDGRDRRKKRFRLTKQGEAYVDEIASSMNGRIQAALETLSAQEVDAVVRGLELYVRALAKTNEPG